MPGAARVRRDNAKGLIVGPGSSTVRIDGAPVSLVGDRVSGHGKSPHSRPTIITGSSTVFVDGIPTTVQQISSASCQHPVFTGSSTVIIGR